MKFQRLRLTPLECFQPSAKPQAVYSITDAVASLKGRKVKKIRRRTIFSAIQIRDGENALFGKCYCLSVRYECVAHTASVMLYAGAALNRSVLVIYLNKRDMKLKKHFVAWLCIPAILTCALGADLSINWDDNQLGVVAGKANDPIITTISELKAQEKEHLQKQEDAGNSPYADLFLENVSLTVDDSSMYSAFEKYQGGGPNLMFLYKGVEWTFDDPTVVFKDPSVGYSVTDTSYITAGSLTINLTGDYLAGQSWSPETVGGVDAYFIPFMECSLFYAPEGSVTVNVEGLGLNQTTSNGFEYVGYVGDLSSLAEGQLGVVMVDTGTEPWNTEDTGKWQGTLLALAAKPMAGQADTPNLPEPTTGTLSLLALAGLCARRRRK